MAATCAYKDCFTTRQAHCQITFFNLPTDPKRREEWIRNSGSDNICLQNLNEKSKRVFCEKHFDEKYKRRQFHRVTLHPTAVPIKYGEETGNQKENSVVPEIISFVEDIGLEEEPQVQEVFVLNVVQYSQPQIMEGAPVESESLQHHPVILNKDAQSRKRAIPVTYHTSDGVSKGVKKLRAALERINVEDTNSVNESQVKVQAASMTARSCQTESTEMYDKSVQVSPEKPSSTEAATQTDQIPEVTNAEKSENTKPAPKIDDEDSYFCVKVIAEAMKRLSPKKKAEAKLHMISYMFGLEHS